MLRTASRTALGAASNAVRLQIAPAPASIAESREILRVIQRFGEVVTFKHLKVRSVFASMVVDKPLAHSAVA